MSDLRGMAAHVAKRIARLQAEESVERLRERPLYRTKALDVSPALAPKAKVVEIMFADPERGLLVPKEKATAEEAVRLVGAAAAAAAAVWCERNFHAGDWLHLEAVRAAFPELPLIARDLVVDPWQIERARAAGADAVELVPELLGPALDVVATVAREIGLAPVVFVAGGWRAVG